jgi:hypothetical protein
LHGKPEPVNWGSGWYGDGVPGSYPTGRPHRGERVHEVVDGRDSSRYRSPQVIEYGAELGFDEGAALS